MTLLLSRRIQRTVAWKHKYAYIFETHTTTVVHIMDAVCSSERRILESLGRLGRLYCNDHIKTFELSDKFFCEEKVNEQKRHALLSVVELTEQRQ